MKKTLFTLILTLYYLLAPPSGAGGAFAQNINKIEYFIDADPGYGSGTDVPITASTPVTANFNVSLSSVADGFHFFSVRARDVSSNWSIVGIRPFYKETVPSASVPNVVAMEYFIDADPGYGAGTALSFTANANVTTTFTASLSSVSDGFHFLSVRAKDANNKWSVVGIRPFYRETVSTATVPNITAMEYFIDADPGYGLGTAVTLTAGSPVTQNLTVALGAVSNGFHFLSIRAKDANNKWSVVGIRPFYKETISTASIPNIVAMEYFIDADPGYGLGTAVTLTTGSPVTQNLTVALGAVSNGFHFLSIRAKDANNKWSVVGIRPFYKETISTATVPNIVAMEYFIDNDPGYGLGTSVPVTAGSPITQNITATLGTLTNGTHKLSIRAKDANNKWSIIGIKDFTVQDNIIVMGTTPSNWCNNTVFNLPFTASGTYTAGNVFTAQLSNASGAFTSPVTLGTLTSTSSGVISGTIPTGTTLGSGYKIRIISSTPSITNNPDKALTIGAICQCLLNASVLTGNWSSSSIWSCGHIPLATEPTQISGGHTVTLDVNGSVKSLNMMGILTQQATKTLTVQGN